MSFAAKNTVADDFFIVWGMTHTAMLTTLTVSIKKGVKLWQDKKSELN